MAKKVGKDDSFERLIGGSVEDLTARPIEVIEEENPSPRPILDDIVDKKGNKIDIKEAAEALEYQMALNYATDTGASLDLVFSRMAEDNVIASKTLAGASLSSRQSFERLLEGMAYGLNDAELAVFVGVSKTTINKWYEKMPSLLNFKETLAGAPTIKAKMNLVGSINMGDVEISKWFLERRDGDFANKTRQEVTGKNGGPIQAVNINIS